jgi:hypothetical protein
MIQVIEWLLNRYTPLVIIAIFVGLILLFLRKYKNPQKKTPIKSVNQILREKEWERKLKELEED